MLPVTDMLDTHYPIEIPEGVNLTLRPAGVVVRMLAFVIDLCIVLASLFFLSLLLSFGLTFGSGLYFIVLFIVWWFYPVFFEVVKNGATPGKKLFGLKVVHDDGTPVTFGSSLLRNLILSVDLLGLVTGIVVMILSPRFQRLGDLVAGTQVVYTFEGHNRTSNPEKEVARFPTRLTLEEQQALVNFAERSKTMTDSRAMELAEHLRPLTGLSGMDAVIFLRRVANGLTGNHETD